MNQETLNSLNFPYVFQNGKELPKNLIFPIAIEKQYSLGILQPYYAEYFFNLIDNNRLHLRKWLPWVDSLTTQLQALQFIQDSIQENKDLKSLRLGIFYHSNIIGGISLLFIDYENKTCKTGYWIAENYQGKGIVTKACKIMLLIAFQYLDLQQIIIECGVENNRSRAIPQKLGFKADKILKNNELVNGYYIDHMQYVLEFKQWENNDKLKLLY